MPDIAQPIMFPFRRFCLLTGLTVTLLAGCGKSPESDQSTKSGSGKSQSAAKSSENGKSGKLAGLGKSPAKSKTEVARKSADPVTKTKKEPIVKKETGKPPITGVVAALEKFKELGAEMKFNSLDELIHLDLKNSNEPITDEHMALLKHFPDLIHLNLSYAKITDAGMVNLADLDRMNRLYLFDVNISDKGVKHLSKMTRLEILCLDETNITDKGVESLKDLTDLWRFHIQSRNTITDAGLNHLSNMKRLTELNIRGTKITDDRVKQLKRDFPRCKVTWDRAEPKAKTTPQP